MKRNALANWDLESFTGSTGDRCIACAIDESDENMQTWKLRVIIVFFSNGIEKKFGMYVCFYK